MDLNSMGNMLKQQHKIGAKSKSKNKSNNRTNKKSNKTVNRPSKPHVDKATTTKVQKPTYKKSKKSEKSTVPDNKSLAGSLTLSISSIAKLNALKRLYHLRSRDLAFKMLNHHSIAQLVGRKGVEGKQKFNILYKAYEISTRPKAAKRYKKLHEK